METLKCDISVFLKWQNTYIKRQQMQSKLFLSWTRKKNKFLFLQLYYNLLWYEIPDQ